MRKFWLLLLLLLATPANAQNLPMCATPGSTTPAVCAQQALGNAGFPVSATPVANSSGNVAAATATATLPASATKFTYISGFQFTSAGATGAAVVNCTVTGMAGGTQTYTMTAVAGATLANQPLIVAFNPPMPSSAINTAIVASCPSLGAGNTNATMAAQGFQQ
jgi:hypothetical protein